MQTIPLKEWFNTNEFIDELSIRQAEATIALNAYVKGINPDSVDVRRACQTLRREAKANNKKLKSEEGCTA